MFFDETKKLLSEGNIRDIVFQGAKDGFRLYFTRTDIKPHTDCVLVASTSKKVRVFLNPATITTEAKKLGMERIVVDFGDWEP